jgi:hypothetical protein
MLMLIACGAGVYLGLHFNILGLLPLSLLWAGAFILTSELLTSEQSLFDSAGVLLVPLISIQAGFMLGLTARETYGQLRLNTGQSKRV